jgi:hypothetical protein
MWEMKGTEGILKPGQESETKTIEMGFTGEIPNEPQGAPAILTVGIVGRRDH